MDDINSINRSVSELEKIIRSGSADPKTFNKLALNYQKLNRLDKAIETLEEARGSNKTCERTYVNLSFFYSKINNYEKVIEVTLDGINEDFRSADIFYNLSIGLNNTGRVGEAVSVLENSIDLGFSNALIFRHLGILYHEDGQLDKAIETLEESRRLGKIDESTHLNLCLFYTKSEKYDSALEVTFDGINEGFRSAAIFFNYSNCLRRIGREGEAVSVLENSIKLDFMDPDIFKNLTQSYLDLGHEKKAIDKLKSARKLGYNIAPIFNNLGFAYQKLGLLDEAIETLEEARQLGETNENIYGNLSTVYIRSGDSKKAEDIAKEGIDKKGYKTTALYFNLAAALANLDYNPEAISALEESIDLDLGDARTYYIKAELNWKSGNPDAALDSLRKAEETGNINSDILFFLAYITKDKGYIEKIRDIAKEPDNKDYNAYAYLSNVDKDNNITDEFDPHQLKMMVSQMREHRKFLSSARDYKQTMNKIKVINPQSIINKVMVVKESKNSFEEEIRVGEDLSQVMKDIAHTPKYIDHFDEKDMHYLIMTYESGKTLTDLINTGKASSKKYGKVLDTLAHIHVHMPKTENNYDFKSKVVKNVSPSKLDISDSLGPIISAIDKPYDHPHWVFNKDAHTDNWLFDENRLFILDTDHRSNILMAADLAHFLNCVPHYVAQDRYDSVFEYIGKINELSSSSRGFNLITDEDDFIRQYFNAAVYRGIEKFGYFSSIKRRGDALEVLETVNENIGHMFDLSLIEKTDAKHYNKIWEEVKSVIDQ